MPNSAAGCLFLPMDEADGNFTADQAMVGRSEWCTNGYLIVSRPIGHPLDMFKELFSGDISAVGSVKASIYTGMIPKFSMQPDNGQTLSFVCTETSAANVVPNIHTDTSAWNESMFEFVAWICKISRVWRRGNLSFC
ncbi:unnamed protein product [Colias eurytheme]|nr:unnamed protein product [Colias eurytheme]